MHHVSSSFVISVTWGCCPSLLLVSKTGRVPGRGHHLAQHRLHGQRGLHPPDQQEAHRSALPTGRGEQVRGGGNSTSWFTSCDHSVSVSRHSKHHVMSLSLPLPLPLSLCVSVSLTPQTSPCWPSSSSSTRAIGTLSPRRSWSPPSSSATSPGRSSTRSRWASTLFTVGKNPGVARGINYGCIRFTYGIWNSRN